MEENRINEQLKEILKKEGLSWEKFNERAGAYDRVTLRRNLLAWLEKAEKTLNTIDYEISIIPKEKKDI